MSGRDGVAQLVRYSRTLARMVTTHVPEEAQAQRDEKGRFLSLVVAFAYATKHRLRNEQGFLWDDLYPLICWLPRVSLPARTCQSRD